MAAGGVFPDGPAHLGRLVGCVNADPEPDLLQRAAAGDRAAMAWLWEQNRRWLAACLLAHLPSGQEVEDLLQEVAAAVVAELPALREPGRFRYWLRSIAVNVARSDGRRRTRRARLLAPLQQEPVDPASTLAGDERAAERLAQVLVQLRTLPVAYREPLLLRAIEGMPQRRIAEVMGLSEAAVETRLARARRMLRERLAAIEGDEQEDHQPGAAAHPEPRRERQTR